MWVINTGPPVVSTPAMDMEEKEREGVYRKLLFASEIFNIFT